MLVSRAEALLGWGRKKKLAFGAVSRSSGQSLHKHTNHTLRTKRPVRPSNHPYTYFPWHGSRARRRDWTCASGLTPSVCSEQRSTRIPRCVCSFVFYLSTHQLDSFCQEKWGTKAAHWVGVSCYTLFVCCQSGSFHRCAAPPPMPPPRAQVEPTLAATLRRWQRYLLFVE